MIIEAKKFGNVLTSRDSGREALFAFEPTLQTIGDGEEILVDFDGISTISPSWGDEFLTPLAKRYGSRLKLKKTENLAVIMTLEMLEEVSGVKFTVV